MLTTTKSTPTGISPLFKRNASRTSRLMRFRSLALRILFLPTEMPRRAWSSPFSAPWTTMKGSEADRLRSKARRKSEGLLMRSRGRKVALGSIMTGNPLGENRSGRARVRRGREAGRLAAGRVAPGSIALDAKYARSGALLSRRSRRFRYPTGLRRHDPLASAPRASGGFDAAGFAEVQP